MHVCCYGLILLTAQSRLHGDLATVKIKKSTFIVCCCVIHVSLHRTALSGIDIWFNHNYKKL
jgi:hypothetical protein